MSLDKELASSVLPNGAGNDDPVSLPEGKRVTINKDSDNQTKKSDGHITSSESFLVSERREEDDAAPEVEAVCASVVRQKENRQKRACVFVERLQRLKTRMSLLDTSRLGRMGAEGTLLDMDIVGKQGSTDEFVTPRSIHIDLEYDTEDDNAILKNTKTVTRKSEHSGSEISNSKLVENVNAEVEMLNSSKSKQTKKQKVSIKVGLHTKTKVTKGKPKLGNKLGNKHSNKKK